MGDALDGLMRAWNKPSRPQQSDDWLHPPPTQHTAGVVSLGGGTAGSTGHCLGRPGGDGGRSSWCGHGGSCAFPGVAHGGAGLVPGSYDSGGAPELGRRGVSSAACSGPSSGPGSGLGSGPSGSGLRGNLGRGASGGIGSNVSGSLHSGAGGNLGFAGRGGGGGVVDTRSSGLVGCAGSLPGGGLRAYDGPTSARSHASESVALRLPMGRLADRGGQDAAAHAGTAAAAASCRPTDPHAIALASPAMAPSDKIAAAGPPEHGFAGDQNARHRKYMEDDHVAVGGFAGHSPDLFCALYDGHGGREAVDFVVKHLHTLAERSLRGGSGSVAAAFCDAFLKVDRMLLQVGSYNCGTTASVCLYRSGTPHGAPAKIHVANVGDSRGLLVSDDAVQRLTVDHLGTHPDEVRRVEQEGGRVINNRVGGALAVTRALGDHALKGAGGGVTAEPHYVERQLTSRDRFVVLASDGVWDVVDEEEAAQMVLAAEAGQTCAALAQMLVDRALAGGTRDNVSALVVRL